jgi:hypothetical protein
MSMFVWFDMHVPCILDVHRIIEMSLLCVWDSIVCNRHAMPLQWPCQRWVDKFYLVLVKDKLQTLVCWGQLFADMDPHRRYGAFRENQRQ